MWDLFGNPEDQFSHNEAHMASDLGLHCLPMLKMECQACLCVCVCVCEKCVCVCV